MLLGVSYLNLDSKGRLAMPSKYRERLSVNESGEMVLTIDPKKCLILFPYSEWLVFEQKLQEMPTFDRQARALRGIYMNHATEVKLDGGGRILIPQKLRDYANLEKKVALSGQGRRFEIWNEDSWNELNSNLLDSADDIDWDNPSPAIAALNL